MAGKQILTQFNVGGSIGTDGQVLTSGGSGASMSWEDGGTPAAGVVNEINSLTTDGSCGLTINYTRNGSTTSKFVTITGCGGGS